MASGISTKVKSGGTLAEHGELRETWFFIAFSQINVAMRKWRRTRGLSDLGDPSEGKTV